MIIKGLETRNVQIQVSVEDAIAGIAENYNLPSPYDKDFFVMKADDERNCDPETYKKIHKERIVHSEDVSYHGSPDIRYYTYTDDSEKIKIYKLLKQLSEKIKC